MGRPSSHQVNASVRFPSITSSVAPRSESSRSSSVPASCTKAAVGASRVRPSRAEKAAAFDKGGAQGARESVLVVGQKVRAFIANCWQPGKVESVCPEPNSYMVRLDDGRLFRRTRNAINANQSVTADIETVIARPVAPVGTAAAIRPASAPPQPDTPAQQSQQPDNTNTSLLQSSVVLANGAEQSSSKAGDDRPTIGSMSQGAKTSAPSGPSTRDNPFRFGI